MPMVRSLLDLRGQAAESRRGQQHHRVGLHEFAREIAPSVVDLAEPRCGGPALEAALTPRDLLDAEEDRVNGRLSVREGLRDTRRELVEERIGGE
jgi:hypothetical protein